MGDEHATAASAASRSWDRSPSWLAPLERPDFRCRLLRQLRDRPISVGSSGSRLRCTYLWQGEPCTVACLLLFVVVIYGVKRSEIKRSAPRYAHPEYICSGSCSFFANICRLCIFMRVSCSRRLVHADLSTSPLHCSSTYLPILCVCKILHIRHTFGLALILIFVHT